MASVQNPPPLFHLFAPPEAVLRLEAQGYRVRSPGAKLLAQFAMRSARGEGQPILSGTLSCAAGMWVVIRWWYRTQYAPAKHGQGGSSSAGSEGKLTTWLRSKGRGSASTNSSGELDVTCMACQLNLELLQVKGAVRLSPAPAKWRASQWSCASHTESI